MELYAAWQQLLASLSADDAEKSHELVDKIIQIQSGPHERPKAGTWVRVVFA